MELKYFSKNDKGFSLQDITRESFKEGQKLSLCDEQGEIILTPIYIIIICKKDSTESYQLNKKRNILEIRNDIRKKLSLNNISLRGSLSGSVDLNSCNLDKNLEYLEYEDTIEKNFNSLKEYKIHFWGDEETFKRRLIQVAAIVSSGIIASTLCINAYASYDESIEDTPVEFIEEVQEDEGIFANDQNSIEEILEEESKRESAITDLFYIIK